MPQKFPRRGFLAGAIAVGTFSAVGTYFAPGGSLPSEATLRLLTGVDPTGSIALLTSMWNAANPRTQVRPEPVSDSTSDQLAAMVGEAEQGTAAVLNLDIIDLPMFQARSLVEAIDIEDRGRFLTNAMRASCLGSTASDAPIWAAPYTTNVGMTFQRGPQAQTLRQVLDEADDPSPGFVGQLAPPSRAASEAFTVNVLEQALWRTPTILGDGSGVVSGPNREGFPVPVTEVWQQALDPLRRGVRSGRIVRAGDEDDTRDRFTHAPIPYMRNWPVYYRDLQRVGDPDALTRRITVAPTPRGILGGQCLAVVANSPLRDRAADFVRFMVSPDAQRILTAYGAAPAHSAGYSADLRVFVPHLDELRGALDEAALRPVHPRYREFSDVVYGDVRKLLDADVPLPPDFGARLARTLS